MALPATRTNLSTNPSFETASGTVTVRTNLALDPSATATTNWSPIGSATNTRAVDTTIKHEGAGSVKTTVTSAAALGIRCAVSNPGYATDDTIRWSVWVYPSATMSIQPYWERATPTYVGASGGAAVSCPANTWTQLTGSVTFTAAQADATGGYGFGFFSAAAWAVNDVFYADEIIVERNVAALNPFFTGATAAAGDFTYAWTGTADASTSVQQAPGFAAPSGQQYSSTIQSTAWAASGTKSMRNVPRTTASATWPGGSGMAYGMQIGKTYTISAKVRLAGAQTGTPSTYARRISIHKQAGAFVTWSPQAANAAGVYDLSVTFTVPSDATSIYPVLYNGSDSTDIWWDNLLVEEAGTAKGYFDGSSTNAPPEKYAWTGTAHASTSTAEYYGVYAEVVSGSGMPRTYVYAAGLGNTATECRIVRAYGMDEWTVPGWRARSVLGSDVTTDWGVPLGVDITYYLYVNGQPLHGYAINVPATTAWVCDPLQPDLAMPVDTANNDPGTLALGRGSMRGTKYDSQRDLSQPAGSRYRIARAGQRTAGSDVDLVIYAHRNAVSDQFRGLVADAPILLFKVLPSWGAPSPLMYLSSPVEETGLNRDRGGQDTMWKTSGELVAAVLQPPVSGAPTYDEVQTAVGSPRTYDSVQTASGAKRYVDIQANPLGLGT